MADNAKATASADLGYELVVRHAFMDYQIGDRISDAAKIQEILAGELACYVYKAAKAE
ncbi:TPA: hypothetical protein ACR8QZ_003880 [Enterobacter roggenkampii]|jgi:hypothetical protein|uniref:hypothetical protein n=1 Tax=Enterobacter TaxID=547 RepID=UPI000A772F40|nr:MULTISPECIES: hypothetical protein [Enterobacter]DAL36412.1 MAG TPA_asm: hypothetical protein [Caudoviricetes sp.]MBE8915093.1 hypothetical protein [Enterobacter kobei]MDU2079063.1 hypothetical protein [Enterobacter sp.]HCM9127871.1 hypothetical protein [Enterobacter asburiae]HCR1930453.1 hypothetical protein [Enterobacter roggenkampii]